VFGTGQSAEEKW